MPRAEHDRYDIRKIGHETYEVFDVATGAVLVFNGVEQSGLDIQDADELAEAMEELSRRTAPLGSTTRQ